MSVFYLEYGSPDSPWPEKPLAKHETVLSGTFISIRGMRFHFSWSIPKIKAADAVILNGYMGLLFQWFLRFKYKKYSLIFWGERMAGSSSGLKGILQRWFSSSLRNCKAIVAIGTRAQKEYQKRFPQQPVFNIPYHCNINEFQKIPLRKARGSVRFLFCGQMIYRKGLDVLLSAFDRLVEYNNSQLHLVGREAELTQMLSKVADSSRLRIIYQGFQPPDQLPEFFAQADVFVLPSRNDGWGVVVNQALGAGLPIICSDQVGAGIDLIDEGKNGFRFRSGDRDDLLRRMKNFLDHPELIESMSVYSRQKSYQLTPEAGALQWVQVLNQI